MASDTRTALLDVAEEVVRSRGFDAFSFADLADRIGIRKASVHYHFPTKADLSEHLMQRYAESLAAQRGRIDAVSESGGARFSALIDLYRAAIDGGSSLCLCVALSVAPGGLSDEVIRQITQFRSVMIDWISGVLRDGQADGSIMDVHTPEADAAAVLAMLEGAQLAARATQSVEPFDAATRLLRDRVVPKPAG